MNIAAKVHQLIRELRSLPLEPITPKVNLPVVVAAEHQPEYQKIPIALATNTAYPHSNEGYNTVVTAFTLTPNQRQRIYDGEDVYVGLLTFGRPMQPIIVTVGPDAWEPQYLSNVDLDETDA